MAAQKLYRSDDDRVISGLCGGIGEYFDIDSTVVRIVFVILALWGGVGIVLYIIGILLIPQRSDRLTDGDSKEGKRTGEEIGEKVSAVASEIRENLRRSNRKSGGMRADFILGLVIIIFGILLLLENIFPKFGFNLFWPIVLILIGVLILNSGIRKGDR